ncbi:MAG: UDP-2,3-diacylglucosamine diphosphatase [Gemmatimonadota bacterium]|nr:UDP-2,3-diacylglucosamine diphosphatase [Gemmatimonadota bacterium]
MPSALHTPCLVLSDAHLGTPRTSGNDGTLGTREDGRFDPDRSIVALMELARREAKSVVINGDLFDFWFEWRSVMPRVGFRALAAIAAAAESGVRVVWIAGNHDCWGGDVLREAGVEYHVGPWRGTIGTWETLIEHGDGLRDREDAGYRALRAVLRHPAAIWAFRHLLHPDWASALARSTSHTSRGMRPRDGGEGLAAVAQARLAADPALDLYVYGHTHAAAMARAPEGGVYANPGAWMDGPRFLRLSDDAVTHCELSAERPRELKRMELRAR